MMKNINKIISNFASLNFSDGSCNILIYIHLRAHIFISDKNIRYEEEIV